MPCDRIGGEESVRPASRLSRIKKAAGKMIKKAIMGYVPEEEVSYKQRAAQQAAAAAKLRGEPEVNNKITPTPDADPDPTPVRTAHQARPDQSLPRSSVFSLPKSYLKGCAGVTEQVCKSAVQSPNRPLAQGSSKQQ